MMDGAVDLSRCGAGARRLIAAADDRTGRTVLACLFCDEIDPLRTDAIKWANSWIAQVSPGVRPQKET
jgi:hypothetical protein